MFEKKFDKPLAGVAVFDFAPSERDELRLTEGDQVVVCLCVCVLSNDIENSAFQLFPRYISYFFYYYYDIIIIDYYLLFLKKKKIK